MVKIIGANMSKTVPSEMKLMMSFWDGGRCHFTRTMALAEEAKIRGHEVGVVTSEKYAPVIGSLAIVDKIFVIPTRPPNTPPPPYEFPLYSHAFRHAQRLRGLGFDNVDWLHKITEMEIAAIEEFKPDVIVNDYRDTIRTAAQAKDIPVAGVTHTTGSVDGLPFAWWTKPPENAVLPDCRDSFNEVRSYYNLYPINDEREMFSGDITLIASSPSLEPLARDSENTHHVGMLSKWKPDNDFEPIDPTLVDKNIFSYVGETTRPQYGYEEMLTRVIEREPQLGFYIVGNVDRYNNPIIAKRQRDKTVVVADFIPGPNAIHDSAVTLNHGGHGTTMLSLALGRPLICIGPYQSECASSFRGTEEQGAGIMLNHSTGPLEQRPAPDLGENVEIFGYWHSELTSGLIHETINKVINDESFTLNAQRLGRELLELGGVVKAMDLIQEIA
jgi:UDP:flavonoid glycosyltransferase YjiC (YdhE family)